MTMSMPPGGSFDARLGGRRLAFFRIFLLCSLMFQNLSPQVTLITLLSRAPLVSNFLCYESMFVSLQGL